MLEYYSKNIILLLYLYETCFRYLLDNDNITLNNSLTRILIVGMFRCANESAEMQCRVAGSCSNGYGENQENRRRNLTRKSGAFNWRYFKNDEPYMRDICCAYFYQALER